GAGKTFFVQQVRAAIGPSVRSYEINLAETDEAAFRAKFGDIARLDETSFCFVDEIDSKPNEPWPYEALLPILESGGKRGRPRIIILAGSSGTRMDDLERSMAARPKGSDLLSRIPLENIAEIPPMTAGDRLLVTLASFQTAGSAMGHPVAEVEKLALYYVLLSPSLGSARQLREFASRALQRIPPGEDRVKYDHLFDPGDPRNKEFWIKARSQAPDLAGSFVQVEE
ncbi:MAG: hypothetical protein L3J78_04780, partial [Thermoplasmata archaeon]|nr:hypothetical protein [Thermoplasmata archaeon]